LKVLQINTTVNSGSTGRIAEDIGQVLLSHGHESYIAYGRGSRPSKSHLIKIGTQKDVLLHGVTTALFDRHAFGSRSATIELIKQIDKIKPDLVALHNLHGYYINIEVLFEYLNRIQIPVVWTLFDCWAFTGHCTYFDDVSCERWIKGCFSCPKTRRYPTSYFVDNSKQNYERKKDIFNSPRNMTLIVHSKWLQQLVIESFLQAHDVKLIHSGVDLDVFRPVQDSVRKRYQIENTAVILGCASIWDRRKGLEVFLELAETLPHDQRIILVGLSKRQIQNLPPNVIGIARTESIEELAALYSAANVFVNPTFQDNFPTTNLEALACGTPVVTFQTGGSPEAIDSKTGAIVPKGSFKNLSNAIQNVIKNGKASYSAHCRERAVRLFDKNERYKDYLNIFEKIVSNN
jgi:putative colanic acid biosynthesis glycosyltransferase